MITLSDGIATLTLYHLICGIGSGTRRPAVSELLLAGWLCSDLLSRQARKLFLNP